jgi:hypothetical protein
MSISAWVKISSTQSGSYVGIVSKGAGDGKDEGYAFTYDITNNMLLFTPSNGSGTRLWANSTIAKNLEDDTWHNVAVSADRNGNAVFYVDGANVGSESISSLDGTDISDSSENLLIGSWVSSHILKGNIDEVKIYKYVRTASQIQQDYNSGKAGNSSAEGANVSVGESPKWMTDGLVGHWKMDEASGTVVADASGNGNTGTLTNAQETGTSDASGNSVTTMVDTDGSLSTTDDAYNGMILYFPNACGSIFAGSEKLITDYTGASKTFTFAALADIPNSCAYEIRHQTGGKFGNGTSYGGDNDYVSTSAYVFPTSGQYNEDKSISTWVKPGSLGSMFKNIFSQSNANDRLIIYLNRDLWIQNSSVSQVVCANVFQPNNWTNIQIVFKKQGSDLVTTFYANGSSCGSLQFAANIASGFNGTRFGGGTYPFDGTLDDVRVYNRALSPDEVSQLADWGPGPVGHWKMDENVSGNGQTIYDQSGNGNNGTTDDGANNTGMDCTKQGKYGGGCNFDGTDDYVGAGTSRSLDIVSSVTLNAWVKPDTLSQTSPVIIIKDGYGDFYRMRFYSGGNIRFNTYGTSDSELPSTSNLVAGVWNHVEMVYDGSTKKIYINGKLDASEPTTGLMSRRPDIGYADTATELRLGGWGTYFQGVVDDVRVYNYARTPKQVVEDMNAGHPVGGSPLGSQTAYWKFDEGHDTTAQDSSQNNKDLTLSASSAWTNSGKFGRAFDGADNRRVYDNADDNDLDFAATDDFALTGWVKSTDNPAATQYILHKQVTNEGYAVYMETDGDIVFGIGDTSSASFPEDTAGNAGRDFADGAWHYYSAVKTSNTRIDLYVDGNLIGSDTSLAANATLENSATLYIGDADAADGTNEFLGEIDEVKIYRAALTPEQIALDMNQGKELQLGGQTSATGATGQAAEYCVPGDATSCAPPVGEWKFDEKTGVTAYDTSDPSIGGGKNGTLGSDSTWKRGYHGSAVRFGGTGDDVVALPSSKPGLDFGTGSFSISTWLKAESLTNLGDIRPMEMAWCTAEPSYMLMNLNSNGRVYFQVADSTGTTAWGPNSADGVIDLNNWHHVYIVMNRSTNIGQIYVDGKPSGSPINLTLTGNVNCASTNVCASIGGYCWGFNFQGSMDEFRFWNYARTPAQIAWDYNRGKPVGWWKLDEGEGDKAYDSSGNGNVGTLTTMDPPNDWVTGKFGKALDFDGNDDWVDVNVGSKLQLGNNVSESAWVYPTENGNSAGADIGGKGYSASPPYGSYGLEFYNNNQFALGTGATDNSYDALKTLTTGYTLNRWYHVVGTYDGTTKKIYIDGVLNNSSNYSKNIAYNTTDFSIGAWANEPSGNNNWKGLIDDVRVYNYALTAEQVKQVMNEGSVVRFGD